MSVRLLDWRLRGVLLETRMPFRFGIAVMNEIAHVFVFITAEIDGEREIGVAADNLPPKWFTKNPETSYRAEVAEMIGVIEMACTTAEAYGVKDSVFELWRDVYSQQVAESNSVVSPALTSFGVSLVERAVIDAFCRAQNMPFAEAVRSNQLGIRLGDLHPTLSGCEPREFLPASPTTQVRIRHTVGLSDPLTASDDAEATPADSLPSALEDAIDHEGLRRFKVKVGGDREVDLDRLERVGNVLDSATGGDYRVTLDGNEQFADVGALQAFWEELTAGDRTSELARRIDYVEQPLPRDLALGDETSAGLAAWPARPRVIVDESDDSLDAVARAIEAGYDGGAFKSSKGVFKGIGNACWIEHLRQAYPGRTLIFSAEDSSTIGPVGLLADLAVIATLGIDEPERNGHHYFYGLAGFPPQVERETLRHHGDLYSADAEGHALLNIREGEIEVGSIVTAPFGVAWSCDFEAELDGAESLVASVP